MTTKTRSNSFVSKLVSQTIDNGFMSQDVTNFATRTWNDTFIGVENPGWRKQIASGTNATTPASGVRSTIVAPFGSISCRQRRPNNGSFVYWTQFGNLPHGITLPSDPSGLSTSSADIQARIQFLSRYRQARTAFQGGTFLGELAETVHMIKNPALSLRRGIDDYVRNVRKRYRKSKNSPKLKKQLSDTWLEYSYGWAPFVSDIQNAVKLLDAQPDRYSQKITGRGDASGGSSWSAGSYGQSGYNATYQEQTTGTVSVRYKGGVDCRFHKAPTFAEQLGFTPSQFIPTVWELIPYSFLVDYFTNLGKIIDGASLGSVSLAWGCRSQHQTFTKKRVGHKVEPLLATPAWKLIYLDVSVPDSYSQVRRFSRSSVSSVSVSLSDFRFRLPGIGEPFKWLNIAALAAGRSLR